MVENTSILASSTCKKKANNNGSLMNKKEKNTTLSNMNYEHGHNVLTVFGK